MQSFFPLPVFILSVQIDKIVLADITLTNKGNNKDSELSGDSIYISSKIPHYKLWWHKWILYVQDIYLQCLSLPLLPPLWDPATSPWSVWLVQLPLGFGEDSMGGSEQEESFDNPRGTFCHRWCGCLFCFRRGWGLKSKQRVKQQNKGWTSASSNCSLVITQAPLQWSKVHIWRFGQYYSVLEEI